MKITVTIEDIKQGDRYAPTSCPVALAIKRAGYQDIIVGHHGIYSAGMILIKRMPRELSEFVLAFDAGKRVKPVTFDL